MCHEKLAELHDCVDSVCASLLNVTKDEYEIQFTDVFNQIEAYLREDPINVINPEVLTLKA